MSSWLGRLVAFLRSGERRHVPRVDEEQRQALKRQRVVATRLARRLGTTPEDLLDYRRADRILANHR